MLLTLSNALFLAQFNVEELPRIYMVSAVVLLVANYVYGKMEHRFQIQHLILSMLLLSAISIFVIRILIYSIEYRYAPVLLLIWYQVIYMVCGNAFWALASLIFDLRESKRTFSLLSAGDAPAKLLGYLAISAFAAQLGVSNFLFISVACFLISFFFMRNIILSKKVDFTRLNHKETHLHAQQAASLPGPLEVVKSFFVNNLILLISLLSFIVVVSLTVIDFTFLSEVKLKFNDDVALAAFLGSFFALGRIIALLAKITLTSRIEHKLGIRRSLLILPVLLIAFTVFILLSKQYGSDFTYYLYVFGIMVVVTEVLKSVIQDPLILVLFQPLKPDLRLKGHSIAKGILAPMGLFFAGIFIYINIMLRGGMHIVSTCILLLFLCVVWIGIVYLLDRQYIASLIESLKSGFFRGNFLLKNDEAVKALLVEKMKSPKTLDVFYAAGTLEKLDIQFFSNSLGLLLEHKNPDIRNFAFQKIRDNKVMVVVPKIESLLLSDIPDEMKIECLITLSALHEHYDEALVSYLDHPDINIQKKTIAALFTNGDINAIIRAGERLLHWIDSTDDTHRISAAQIIGRLADKKFYSLLPKLMNDTSAEVQSAAITAAGEIKNKKLIPLLFEKLTHANTAKTASLALSACGEQVIDYFPGPEEIKKLIRKDVLLYMDIAVHTKGEKAKWFLEKLLLANTSLKQDTINALKEINYVASSGIKEHVVRMIENEVDASCTIVTYIDQLYSSDHTSVLRDALTTELRICETNIFYLLSFINERQKFLEAFENIKSGRKENIANAIEVIDLGLSKRLCEKLIPVIEYLHLNELPKKQPVPSNTELLNLIGRMIDNAAVSFSAWTKAVSMYTMNLINPGEAAEYLKDFPVNGEYILQETKNFVLSKQR